MRSRVMTVAVSAVVFMLAAPVSFIVQTVLADQLQATTMTAALALGVFVLATLVTGLPRRTEIVELGWSGALEAVLAGGLGIFLVQYLVLAHRYSDAPPGTEVIFFTTACWGVLVLVASVALRKRFTLAQFAAAGIALFGVAALLANWERPSSFSPFVRYPAEEVWMLVAGAGWAAFSVLVTRLARKHRLRAFLPLATGAAAAVSVAVMLLGAGRGEFFSQNADTWLQLLVATSTLAAMIVSWVLLVRDLGPDTSSSLLFLPAVTLSTLGVLERQAGLLGPSPLLWQAVVWASVATVAGAAAVAVSARARGHALALRRGQRTLARAAAALAGLASVSAVGALWAPALLASVMGTSDTGARYAASWTMTGAETPAGWIALFAALLALLAAMGVASGRWAPLKAAGVVLCTAMALAAVPALLDTPLRTWTRWIPAEIQQAYGTEYARLTLARTWGPWLAIALGLTGAASALLVIGLVISMSRRMLRAKGLSEQHA